ncbi:VWA domain-containing protein [Arenimonas caeni]|jgi:Ca-activated chloride channel family protein|uniref:vWA domain-containing protein n=1 Tax=Arenimonas caeni TaxID=2058085 RepID=UPI002A35D5A8|nr:VWA domain-containing protein [Arenimonas caeni]MDY0022990.1 VWA domain-containing protein [Arenimonas caeni]
MRHLVLSTLALAIAAGCAHKVAEEPAQERALAAEAARKERAKRAEIESIEASGSRLAAAPTGMPAPMASPPPPPPAAYMPMPQAPEPNTENYAEFEDNAIVRTVENPVSTFSIDVDTGSYSNVRRMLARGQLPPKDAVRVEEMINYFDYGYPAPTDRSQPFRISTELAPAPWDDKRVLMQVGLKGYEVPREQIPAANLVFLIDTSGSMSSEDKLPLLRESFRQMVPRLRAQDRVSIVVYAGSAGLVLPPTPGDRHGEILDALGRLEAGGSTNGGEGIALAYAMAKQGFIEGGVNRVILATDGDFNVGIYDTRALETQVEHGREAGVALTTLGFGMGNYNDALAERLADVGDGNHAYIDNLMEGRKVLVEEMSSTLLTIASDVKIQVEFNPAQVAEYRLVGYENRQLAREDFNNDQVDAGEIGAGHDVTAIYELCLVGMGCESSDPLRYGAVPAPATTRGQELAFLKLRYKQPGNDHSVLVEQPVTRRAMDATASESLRFAAAVAAYADLLRGGRNMNGYGWDEVEALARGARGEDPWGYRGEFLNLVAQARSLAGAAGPARISEE